MECKKCGSKQVYVEQKGTQFGLYCSNCHSWIKWLNKVERRQFEHKSIDTEVKNEKAEYYRFYFEGHVGYVKATSEDDAFNKVVKYYRHIDGYNSEYFTEYLRITKESPFIIN